MLKAVGEFIVRFMSAAVEDRQQKLIKIDDETYDLVTVDGSRRARFTLNRETATGSDTIELMGLDHPLVQEELGRWRSVPPEEIGSRRANNAVAMLIKRIKKSR